MSKIIRILLSAGKGDWASLPSEICGAAAAHHPAQSHQKREIPRQEQPDDSLYNSMYSGKRSRDALSLPGIRTAGYRYLDYRVYWMDTPLFCLFFWLKIDFSIFINSYFVLRNKQP